MESNGKTWLKVGLKVGLALLILFELGVAGFWASYRAQASQGLLAIGVIRQEMGATVRTWVDVEVVLSVLGWLALVNAMAILFTALYVCNPVKFPVLPLIFLIGDVALGIRGALLSIWNLTGLFLIGIAVAVAVVIVALLNYTKPKRVDRSRPTSAST